jgi:hypothetical protein
MSAQHAGIIFSSAPPFPRTRSGSFAVLCSTVLLSAISCTPLTDVPGADSDDPCVASAPIEMVQSRTGALGSADCLHPDGQFSDRWSLTLNAPRSVRIDLTSPPFAGVLELQDGVGNIMAYGDDYTPPHARIVQDLPEGSYIIVVRSMRPGATGSYELSVGEAPECSPLGSLVLGVPVTGTLSDTDCLQWEGTTDNWSLSLSKAQKLRIDLKSGDFDEMILLRDQNGNVFNGADWSGPTGHARLETELSQGEWTLSVTAPYEDARGGYELQVDVAPPCQPGTDFVIGETVGGELSLDDCLMDQWMPADSFGLVITDETPLSIHLKSQDFSPFVIVRDRNGWDVEVGWDDMQNGSARIEASLAPDTYTLLVSASSYPPQGKYQLSVQVVACGDLQTITFGGVVTGDLGENDCLRSGGAYQDLWQLVLPNDTTVRIDLEGGAIDPFLELRDSAGDTLETNDDGAGGLNARIERTLAAGTYTIVASSYARGQIGSYTLSAGAPPSTTAASDRTVMPGTIRQKEKEAELEGVAPSLTRLSGDTARPPQSVQLLTIRARGGS